MSIVNQNGHEIASDVTAINERQLKRKMAQNATIGDVNEIAHAHAAKAMNHLGNQMPALVEQMCHAMIAQAMAGFVAALKVRFVMVPREPEPAAIEMTVGEPITSVEFIRREPEEGADG